MIVHACLMDGSFSDYNCIYQTGLDEQVHISLFRYLLKLVHSPQLHDCNTHQTKEWKKNHTSIRRALHSISCSFSWVISGFKEDNCLLCSGVNESINSVSISARLEAMPALWASTWLWAVASNLFCISKSNFQNLAYMWSEFSSGTFAVTSRIQTRKEPEK